MRAGMSHLLFFPHAGTLPDVGTWIPLVLSWAMPMHKSERQTIEHVKIDLRRVSEKGQGYGALSRVAFLGALRTSASNRRRCMCCELCAC